MRTKPLFFFIVFLLALFVFFKLDRFLRQGVVSFGDKVKLGILDTKEQVLEAYQSYFDQAKTIKEQSKKISELENLKLQNIELQSELDHLLHFYNLPSFKMSGIYPIRAISYADFGNYERIWLSDYEGNSNGFYGLIFGGYVAGIAKKDQNERLIGYLNGDSLCSYGVYIGKNRALGISRGENNQFLIDYIPLSSEINVGDEVVTNGLDDIFFPNIPVGKVSEVILQNGYLSAKIEPYIQKIELGYLWLLDRTKQ